MWRELQRRSYAALFLPLALAQPNAIQTATNPPDALCQHAPTLARPGTAGKVIQPIFVCPLVRLLGIRLTQSWRFLFL